MDMTGVKPIIVSTGVGAWYGAGIDRLQRSLLLHGYAGDWLFHKELPVGCPEHNDNPYAFKIFSLREAIASGHRILLWLDSSFWCIKTPHELFDIIHDNGVFAFRTGYNCAQTCSDAVLAWAGFTRDEAEALPEIASGAVGLNLDNPDGNKIWTLWQEGYEKGLFKNSRGHSFNDSCDGRFLFARQDQSVISMAIHMSKIKFEYVDYVSYYGTGYNPDKCLFFIGGL